MDYEVVELLSERDAVRTELCALADGTRVVVKTLSLETADEESLRLFEREARVLRALDHPQIPAYTGAWQHEADGRVELKLAQRFVEGRTLSALLREERRWSADELRALGRDVAGVLAHLHALHPPVIHRDIKPSNLLLDDDGRVHLVDFGAVSAPRSSGETVVGTFGYMPPEQYEGRARPASDVYALGMLLCTLVTGREPWEHDEDPRAALRVAAIPDDLKSAILAFLERDPEARPRDGAAALAALRDSPAAARPQAARPRGAREGASGAWGCGVLALVTFGVFLVGGIVFAVFVVEADPPVAPPPAPRAAAPAVDPLQAAVHCASRSARFLEARDRYRSWVRAPGPTCEERHVYGTYAPYDDAAAACAAAAAAAERASWPELVPHAHALAEAARAHTPSIRRAARYYQDRAYTRDDCALGQELHPELQRAFERVGPALRGLTELVDARLRTLTLPRADVDKRSRAAARYYAALGGLAAEAPFENTSSWSLDRLLDAWDRERAAYDELDAAPPPTLPAPLGLWRGTLATARSAHSSIAAAMNRLRRPGAQLDEGYDPTGVRAAVYRALHVGLQMPIPD